MTPGIIVRALFRVGILSALLVLPPSAAAASRTGDVACDMTLSPAEIDFGRLSRATMAVDAANRLMLPPRDMTITVRCPGPQDMSVFFRALPAGADSYRFGDEGRYTVWVRDATLDGEAVGLARVDAMGGAPTRVDASMPWLPGTGIAPARNARITTGRVFSAKVDIRASMKARALRVADATRWTAQAVIDAASSGVTRELSMRADVIAGSCQVEVARHLSFGHLRASDLNTHGAFTVVPATQTGLLRVACDGPMPLALRIARDERAGTAVAPVAQGLSYTAHQWMGLGRTPAGENIGAYVLHWAGTATSDRGELRLIRSSDDGRTWRDTSDPVVATHTGIERVGYAAANGGEAAPSPVTTLDVSLDASIYIAPRHRLSLNEEIKADGLVTFEIVY